MENTLYPENCNDLSYEVLSEKKYTEKEDVQVIKVISDVLEKVIVEI
jgi:hypothetical protein